MYYVVYSVVYMSVSSFLYKLSTERHDTAESAQVAREFGSEHFPITLALALAHSFTCELLQSCIIQIGELDHIFRLKTKSNDINMLPTTQKGIF